MSIRETLNRLRKENSEALRETNKNVSVSNLNGDLDPSEMKQLTEQIKRRRILGEGLGEEETKRLMNRIGYGRKR